ncbi:Large cysteine-rich periplasmic protein OmcB precursor [Caulifigura coniformis]|uniref:Large cysteine-rich periplasmic protein OmcB n=1 Tax=Caulifigura coniformis TaxID=2527983 RepID=A0A517SAY8_9PLAN|nr:DUF11 domain-containing protein [Caulifigura coniformis]QDT53284.1 Large cysteine-rich periplasmic protein OmcB precursor [Caulifigura coniformis]
MSMMLWKTLALGGVIGVGSVVVVQAKRGLDDGAATAGTTKPAEEEFELLDPETGLETSFEGALDAAPPKKLAERAQAEPLAALAAVSPDDNPFGGEPSPAEVAQASAEKVPDDNPFASGTATLADAQEEPASTVTLDEQAGEKFALLDGAAPPTAPEQSEPNPFDPAPAAEPTQPLKKLSPGNDGPVLMTPPADDNPFSQFVRTQTETAESVTAETSTTEVEPGAPQFDAAPAVDAQPPLRTREPAASLPIELPPATLNPEASGFTRERREPAPQVEPAIASPQDAGLAPTPAPGLPEVARENAPGRVRVAEAELPAPGPEVAPDSLPPFPPLNLTGGEATTRSDSPPSDISSIPQSARPLVNEPDSSIPTDRTIPNEAPPTQDSKGGFGIENSFPARPAPDTFNPDESPTARPQQQPANTFPVEQGQPQGSPFDPLPASSIPTSPANSLPANPPASLPTTPAPTTPAPVTPAPAAQPDLSGAAVLDRNVAIGPAQPQLTIVKQAPSEAVVGQDLEYSILVKNIGRSAAHNVVVEDLIPRGSKCTGTIPKAESQLEKKNLIWKLGTLAAGAEQLIRVRITPTDAGEIGSVATVSFSAAVAAKTVIVEPKATLLVTGPRDAVVGEPAQYKFTITNNGPIDLKGVFVRTVLPGQGLTHPGGNDLEYELGDLPRGKSREVSLAMTPSQQGDWSFDSMVTLNGRELSKHQSALHVVGARLTVVRTGPTKRFVGRSATYSNTVSNNSAQTLMNVNVVESLPMGLDPSGQLSKDVRWDPARRTLTWTIPQLAPGQSVDLPCTVTPKTAGALQGQIVARDASGNHAEIATALEVAGFSSLVVDGGHDGRPVAVGDQVSFRFSVKNRGTAAAEQVVAMFDLPQEVEFISAQGPGNAKFERTGQLIVFDPVPNVLVNGELTYDVVVQAKTATSPNAHPRIRVSLNSTQLPADHPLEQEQQLVIYGDDEEMQPVQRVSGTR